jgi:chaperonin GroES
VGDEHRTKTVTTLDLVLFAEDEKWATDDFDAHFLHLFDAVFDDLFWLHVIETPMEENMYLKLRNGNVAIELLEPESKTPGGIFIPQTVRQGILQYGKIVAAGPGELVQGQFIENDLKKGDEVIFDSSHSEPVKVDGKMNYICNMVDVVATVKKNLSVVPDKK